MAYLMWNSEIAKQLYAIHKDTNVKPVSVLLLWYNIKIQ